MSLIQYRLSAVALSVVGALAFAAGTVRAQAPAAGSENEYLAVLQSADSPAADKAMACKKLAVVGSEAAVPELAKLLSDEHLASWARIALEAIPGPVADEALRTAAGSLDGNLLVGVVNSIGVRRDADAIELLRELLNNDNAVAASSAAFSLGKIGNAEATATLREALAGAPEGVRSAVAEGCVLCAERALADGRIAEATAIYDQVRAADVPKQRQIEAVRGAILAQGDDGIPLLIEQLHSGDKAFFYIALTTARELPGGRIDRALAAELPNMAPFRAPALVATMADRPDTVVLSAIQDASASGPDPVRIAAIAALGRVGDESCIDGLLEIAGGKNQELVRPAKDALAVLPGDRVNQQLVSRIEASQGGVYIALIELIGARRIAALEPLLTALDSSEPAVRAAALGSLGKTVPFDNLPILIAQATAPKHAEDAQPAREALLAAAVRMPDREACATQLAAAIDGAPTATHVALLDIIAAVGGTKALETMHAAGRANKAELRDASTRLLGNWTTADAAPVLLDLSTFGPDDRYQVRALRGYLRIARQLIKDDAERIAMCRNALEAGAQPAEQKLVLEILERNPSVEALKLGLELQDRPALKDDAVRSLLVVAQKLDGHNDEVLSLLSQATLPKLQVEVVKAEYGAPGSQQDVTDILKQQVTDQPVILLPAATYNESFGGDPAPDQRKQLRVEYKIDGKPAEAKFAENRLIVLTLPKP